MNFRNFINYLWINDSRISLPAPANFWQSRALLLTFFRLLLSPFPDSKNTQLSNTTNSNLDFMATTEAHFSPTETSSEVTFAHTHTTESSPNNDNVGELTTEKLSFTNKSLASQLVSESLANVDDSSTTNHTVTSGTHHFKSTNRQRSSSNSLVKSSGSSGGGVRISGQKIEMPQLNDFFDHSAYLKKHENGFRWAFVDPNRCPVCARWTRCSPSINLLNIPRR